MGAPSLYSPPDMEVAAENFDAACGHGALAAVLGCEVCHVMHYFGRGGWVNIPLMTAALAQAGKKARSLCGWCTESRPAVTLIQWIGPWMNPGVPIAARCQHRHWVATYGRRIWDCNLEAWVDRLAWEEQVVPQLMPKRGTGYEAYRSLVWG